MEPDKEPSVIFELMVCVGVILAGFYIYGLTFHSVGPHPEQVSCRPIGINIVCHERIMGFHPSLMNCSNNKTYVDVDNIECD
jgi:hypothetical protein